MIERPRHIHRVEHLLAHHPTVALLGVRQVGKTTLAGRIVHHELDGLALDEVGADRAGELWLRGGFPRSYLFPLAEGIRAVAFGRLFEDLEPLG